MGYIVVFFIFVAFILGFMVSLMLISHKKIEKIKEATSKLVEESVREIEESYDVCENMTNIERIQNMDVEELAKFLMEVYSDGFAHKDFDYTQAWLNDEVKHEQ